MSDLAQENAPSRPPAKGDYAAIILESKQRRSLTTGKPYLALRIHIPELSVDVFSYLAGPPTTLRLLDKLLSQGQQSHHVRVYHREHDGMLYAQVDLIEGPTDA